MRRLLLLEAIGNAGEDLLNAACALGVEVAVATHPDIYDRYSDAVKANITEVVVTDFAQPRMALLQLAAWARKRPVDGVITGWEFFSPLVTQLAAELGLPGHDESGAAACRNKWLMNAAFGERGVSTAQTMIAATYQEAADAILRSTLDFPLVVKPAENAGSVGVTVVRTFDELRAAVEQAQRWPLEFPHGVPLDNRVLIQEYLDGKEFSVESVVFRGAITHLAITEKHTTGDTSRAEIGHTVPASLGPRSRRAVLEMADKGLNALGFQNGIAHTELKLGADGMVKIIEIGARPPGDHIMKLVEYALGISEARAYIQVALGDEPDLLPCRDESAAIRFITPPRAGVFLGLSGIPEVGPIVDSAVYVQPGTSLGSPTDNVARIGHVIMKASGCVEVNSIARDVMQAVAIEMG
jgi:biotin carboxylase